MSATSAEVLDLRGCTFATPGGLVALACEVRRQVEAGRRVTLEAPRNFDVACWLDRMDVPKLVPDGCASGFHGVQHHPRRDRLVELVEIEDGESEIEHMAELVVNRVRLEGQARSELYDSLYELALNVCEHSGTSGFIAAQTYRNHLEVAIGDWGTGSEPRWRALATCTTPTPTRYSLRAQPTSRRSRDGEGRVSRASSGTPRAWPDVIGAPPRSTFGPATAPSGSTAIAPTR